MQNAVEIAFVAHQREAGLGTEIVAADAGVVADAHTAAGGGQHHGQVGAEIVGVGNGDVLGAVLDRLIGRVFGNC